MKLDLSRDLKKQLYTTLIKPVVTYRTETQRTRKNQNRMILEAANISSPLKKIMLC